MFKRISTYLLFLSLAVAGRAQILQNIENAFQPWPDWTQSQFYFIPTVSTIFSQIDGDGASGYNKFGTQFTLNTGLAIDEKQAIELSFGYSQRGSQQGIDPILQNFNAFNIQYDYLETGLLYQRKWKKWLFNAGLRGTYLIDANQKLGTAPRLKDDLRTFGLLTELGARARFHKNWAAQITYNYSSYSVSKTNLSIANPIFLNSEQYLNCIGFGVLYLINQR